jgi:hypothetical protein
MQVRTSAKTFHEIEDSDLDGDTTSKSDSGISESRVRGTESSDSDSDTGVESSGSGDSDAESSDVESDDGADDTESLADLSDNLSEEEEDKEATNEEKESVECRVSDDPSSSSDDDAFGAIQDRFHTRVSKNASVKVSGVKPKLALKKKGAKAAGFLASDVLENSAKTAGVQVSSVKASQVTEPKAPSKQRASVKPRGHIEAKELNVAHPRPQTPSSPVLLTLSSSVQAASIQTAASKRVARDSSPRLLLLCSSPSSSSSHDKLAARSTPRLQPSFGSEDPSTLRLSWAACQTLTSEQARAYTTQMPY